MTIFPHRRTTWVWIFILGLLHVSACRSARVGTADEAFDVFYDQFLTDSTFQMDRIQFPLFGEKYTEQIEDSSYQWVRSNWQVLSEPQIDPNHFTRNLAVSDTVATDEIAGINSGFYFKMTYRPINRKWHLVYLVDRDL